MPTDDTSRRAGAGIDFTSITDGIALFPNGTSRSWITLEILNDNLPELDESFQIILTNVMVVGNFSTSGVVNSNRQGLRSDNKPSLAPHGSQLNITIEENDFPYGLFTLTTDLMIPLIGGDSRKIAISEPSKEQKSSSVVIHIERTRGTYFVTKF